MHEPSLVVCWMGFHSSSASSKELPVGSPSSKTPLPFRSSYSSSVSYAVATNVSSDWSAMSSTGTPGEIEPGDEKTLAIEKSSEKPPSCARWASATAGNSGSRTVLARNLLIVLSGPGTTCSSTTTSRSASAPPPTPTGMPSSDGTSMPRAPRVWKVCSSVNDGTAYVVSLARKSAVTSTNALKSPPTPVMIWSWIALHSPAPPQITDSSTSWLAPVRSATFSATNFSTESLTISRSWFELKSVICCTVPARSPLSESISCHRPGTPVEPATETPVSCARVALGPSRPSAH